MRVSKKALRPFAVILVSLSMSALLTGCQTSSDSASQAVGGSDAESTIQQQTTDASNSETNEQNGSNETVASLPQVFVTDVEGNRRNLSDFPWAQKYPTLLDGIASDTLTDYAFYTIASENLKARGESLTCDYFGDQQVTISVAGAEKGEAAAQIPQDKKSLYFFRVQAVYRAAARTFNRECLGIVVYAVLAFGILHYEPQKDGIGHNDLVDFIGKRCCQFICCR